MHGIRFIGHTGGHNWLIHWIRCDRFIGLHTTSTSIFSICLQDYTAAVVWITEGRQFRSISRNRTTAHLGGVETFGQSPLESLGGDLLDALGDFGLTSSVRSPGLIFGRVGVVDLDQSAAVP